MLLAAAVFGGVFLSPLAGRADPQDGTDANESASEEAPPPAKTDPLAGADAPAPDPGASTTTLVRGLSWDMRGGQVPKSGALAEVQLGFPGLLTAAYHYALQPGFSVGGLVSLDYAYYVPSAAWTTSLILAAPVRYALLTSDTMNAAIRADPGIRLVLDEPFTFGILANVEGVIGWTIYNRFVVGLGVDVPLALMIPTRGTVNLSVPVLFGPVAEMHLSPPLAVTLDAKIGPSFNTSGGTQLGLQLLVGAAYRL